jgi:predicted ATP-grasp superfamily ATP-dependent carboligase
MKDQQNKPPVDLVAAVADLITYCGYAMIDNAHLKELSNALVSFFEKTGVQILNGPRI